MESYLIEWANLIVRFVHVITGIAWIGASFYFIWLDNHLESPPRWKADKGIKGDLWAIHGGGFYEVAKYELAPEAMPKTLHWFKWEAYSTWLSGFVLLLIIYYWGAEAYLIDLRVAELSQAQAIGLGLLAIFGGWIVYELLCTSALGKQGVALGIILLALLTLLSFGLFQFFSARGAYIHVGALIGTIMAGNVFRVIMPSQRALVAAVVAGEEPDSSWGAKAKLRSTHNTYATLPIIFIMISAHYPMTYNHPFGWLVLIAIFTIVAMVRWYFVLRHRGQQKTGILIIVAIATAILIYLLSWPVNVSKQDETRRILIEEQEQVVGIIKKHCSNCHSSTPSDDIFKIAPNGVIFDSYQDMRAQIPRIKARAVDAQDMPLLNKTGMTPNERQQLADWIENNKGK